MSSSAKADDPVDIYACGYWMPAFAAKPCGCWPSPTCARFAQLGLDTVGNSPDELAAIIKADLAKWAKVIRDVGIKAGE